MMKQCSCGGDMTCTDTECTCTVCGKKEPMTAPAAEAPAMPAAPEAPAAEAPAAPAEEAPQQ